MAQPLTLIHALELLIKLRDAAPPATGERLGQVAALLQSLAEENESLKARLGISATQTVKAVAPPPGGELLNGVNETLRPPLIAIRGRAELVQAGFLGQITPEQDQWLQSIQENTGRAFALLDTIQQFIALQSGQVRLEAVNFLATDLMTEAWNRVRDKANAASHEISLHVPPTVPLARGDFYQALIILADLLENAILYTPPGRKIRLLTDNLSSHVLFSVIDNGVGLTAGDLTHIGQAFWRGDHHKLVRQHPGTGLRLYLARALLARMGGELIYSGQPGEGSTFSFTLPGV
jgi:signal transduction histidine kinase